MDTVSLPKLLESEGKPQIFDMNRDILKTSPLAFQPNGPHQGMNGEIPQRLYHPMDIIKLSFSIKMKSPEEAMVVGSFPRVFQMVDIPLQWKKR